MKTFSSQYLENCELLIKLLNTNEIEDVVDILSKTYDKGGRLFIIGSGGGAGHASHAVCDFRKICNFEAYSPYDNISELTARVNDDGWDSTIEKWLQTSKLEEDDCIFVFSVGGGSEQHNISMNIVNALKYAKLKKSKIVGIVGTHGGYTKQVADASIYIPIIKSEHITPLTEGFQAVIWHLIVSHPKLKINNTIW